jgi:dTDP-4-dehydrorhamnose 3,5-epimerase
MNVLPTEIPDVKIIEPKVWGDDRGFFFESYNKKEFDRAIGENVDFVQDNHSFSPKNILRGLHYQIEQSQGKLVRVVSGEVFDVAVDLRKSSHTFGKHVSILLSAKNKKMLWIPKGFAHGFLVVSDHADFLYKTTDFYNPQAERCLRWDDSSLQIKWPIDQLPILSPKDSNGKSLTEAEVFP